VPGVLGLFSGERSAKGESRPSALICDRSYDSLSHAVGTAGVAVLWGVQNKPLAKRAKNVDFADVLKSSAPEQLKTVTRSGS
jgi:hypothetical protein